MESPDTKRERTTAEVAGEDLRARVEVIREFRHKTRGYVDLTIDRAVADNALHEELGQFGAYELDYSMDEKRRDILLRPPGCSARGQSGGEHSQNGARPSKRALVSDRAVDRPDRIGGSNGTQALAAMTRDLSSRRSNGVA